MNEIAINNIPKVHSVHEQQGTGEPVKRIVSTLERPEGTYSFLYVTHLDTVTQKMVPQATTHIWIESGSGDWSQHPDTILNSFRITVPEFATMMPILEKRQKPLLFGELSVGVSIGIADNIAETGLEAAEDLLALSMWAYLAMNVGKIELTRRDFLKAGKMVIIAGAAQWLSMPVLANIARISAVLSGRGHEITKVMKKISDTLHPEDYTLSEQIRGTVLSYKEKWLAKKLGNKPYFFTPIGGIHARVETEIDESDASQLSFLRNWSPILKAIVNPKTFSDIIEMEFDGKHWVQTNNWEIPELKQMIESS